MTQKKIKSFSSKSDWRKAQDRFENGEKNTINYKSVITETTKDVHSLINKKFSYLQYKGETIQEGVNASEEVLESFYDRMKCIDSDINWNSKELTKNMSWTDIYMGYRL